VDIDVPSAVEVFTTLRYINLHLLTYLLFVADLLELRLLVHCILPLRPRQLPQQNVKRNNCPITL